MFFLFLEWSWLRILCEIIFWVWILFCIKGNTVEFFLVSTKFRNTKQLVSIRIANLKGEDCDAGQDRILHHSESKKKTVFDEPSFLNLQVMSFSFFGFIIYFIKTNWWYLMIFNNIVLVVWIMSTPPRRDVSYTSSPERA